MSAHLNRDLVYFKKPSLNSACYVNRFFGGLKRRVCSCIHCTQKQEKSALWLFDCLLPFIGVPLCSDR